MDEIKDIARVKFLPGMVEEWKRPTEQAVEIVRTKDRGTPQHEIFFNADESEAIVFERYRAGGMSCISPRGRGRATNRSPPLGEN